MKEEFFYAEDEMVAFANLGWFQTAFDKLTELFSSLGLNTKTKKTMGMAFHPCRAAGVWAAETQ